MDDTQVVSIAADRYAVGAFIGYLQLLVGLGIYSARPENLEETFAEMKR